MSCVAASTFTHTASALTARRSLRHRFPVASAKGLRRNASTVCRRTVIVCAKEEDDEEDPSKELNFQLPSDLQSNFSSNVSGSASSAPGKRVRSVSWSSLDELSTVKPGKHVYILVFGAGSGSEGVYSLQERTREDVPVDIILAFPTYEDASRYSTLLEAEMGRVPIVEAALPEDLMYTCHEGGYKCKVARMGVLLVPPEKTVAVTDWERANALRDGKWTVADGEDGCVVFAGASEAGPATSTRDCQQEDEEALLEEIKVEAQTFDMDASRAMLSRLYDLPDVDDHNDPTI